MFDAHFDECLKQITALTGARKQKKVDEIISNYCPISISQLPALPQIPFHRQDLIEDGYVPSPDLLTTYISNFAKTLTIQPLPQPPQSKLFSSTGHNNMASSHMVNPFLQSSNPLSKPSILIQGKQETILRELKGGKIQSTLPGMEKSLRMYQIANLGEKDIRVENLRVQGNGNGQEKTKGDGLGEWKRMREKFMKNLQKK